MGRVTEVGRQKQADIMHGEDTWELNASVRVPYLLMRVTRSKTRDRSGARKRTWGANIDRQDECVGLSSRPRQVSSPLSLWALWGHFGSIEIDHSLSSLLLSLLRCGFRRELPQGLPRGGDHHHDCGGRRHGVWVLRRAHGHLHPRPRVGPDVP